MVLEELVLAGLRISFQRTCRVPYDRVNRLPAGLGPFPIYRVADYKSSVPKEWDREGFFIPMYPQEAMWINFPQRHFFSQPYAVVVAAGHINAITGEEIATTKTGRLVIKLEEPQNYLVVPPQPWLDGWKSIDGKVYQFVAAELGSGETVESQLTGKEEFGGIQFGIFTPKPSKRLVIESRPREYVVSGGWPPSTSSFNLNDVLNPTRGAEQMKAANLTLMGLGRGGAIEQKIYPDPYGLDVWNKRPAERVVVYIVNSEGFREITGHQPPPTPVTHEEYQRMGLPWFGVWDEDKADSPGSEGFDGLKPVGGTKRPNKKGKGGGKPQLEDVIIPPKEAPPLPLDDVVIPPQEK